MKVIGITGGVGCGKSTVLAYLKETYNATIVQADLVAKNLQEKGEQVFLDIVEAFGQSILDEEGQLDRGALAEIVFHDEMELKLLNSIVHPAVKRHIVSAIEKAREQRLPYFFIEAALLIEDNYSAICDEMWYIYASDDVRSDRLMSSRGYSQEKIVSMIANQRTKEEFMEHCHVLIDNSGSFEETAAQIDIQMSKLVTKSVRNED